MNQNNIYTKLQKIQSKNTEILKDNINRFQHYKYFTEYQALTFLKPLLAEQGLSLHLEDLTTDYKVELMEKNWIVQYWKQATLINTDKPEEKITSKFLALGSNQDIAKAKGVAETYAIKYFLTKFFLIPITDNSDPDREQLTSKLDRELTEEEKGQVEKFLEKHNWKSDGKN